MKRFLLTLLCAAGATLASYAQPNTSSPPADPNGPQIYFKIDTYTFDTIHQGDTVKYTFTFKNTGKQPLVITDAQVGCGCTHPEFPKEPIAPGKSGTIYVEFRSAGKMGFQDKTITIKSNSNGGDYVLHLKGVVVTTPAPAPGPVPGKDGPQGGPVNK